MNEAIVLNNIFKKYKIGTSKKLSSAVTTFFSGDTSREFWAIKNISLKVKHGETVGIIGPNGSGKSTLLRILAGITSPTKGEVKIDGRISSLLELGTGFHPELTGRENIYLYGSILGISAKEIKKQFDQIKSFSGIGKFVDSPVKYYSSGMYIRVAFSVAVYLNPEILLIDEMLSVGDLYFQQKSREKIKEMHQAGVTLVIVSHDLKTVEDLCDRIFIFKNGRIISESKSTGAINSYIEGVTRQVTQVRCKIGKVTVKTEFKKLEIMVYFQFDKQINKIDFAVAASITQKGRNVIAQRNYFLSDKTPGQTNFTLYTTMLPAGVYNLAVNITDKDVTRIYAHKENIYPFQVNKDSSLSVGKNLR